MDAGFIETITLDDLSVDPKDLHLFSNCLNSRSPVTSSAFFSVASAAALAEEDQETGNK